MNRHHKGNALFKTVGEEGPGGGAIESTIRPQTEEIMDTKQLARYLGCSRQWLEIARVKGGGPPFTKIGRLVRYRRKVIDDWLEKHERIHT